MSVVRVLSVVCVAFGQDPVAVGPFPLAELFEAFERGERGIQGGVDPRIPHVVLGDANDEVVALGEQQGVQVAVAENQGVVDRLREGRQRDAGALEGFGTRDGAAFLGEAREAARTQNDRQHGVLVHQGSSCCHQE